MKKIFFIFVMTIISVFIFGELNIVCTTNILGDMIENIGREKIDLNVLMGPGIDPHLYKASARDTKKIAVADLVVYGGLHLEGKMAEIFEKLGRLGINSLSVGDALPEEDLITVDDIGTHDPHIWFSPDLWKKCVLTTAEKMGEVDSENKNFYMENALEYIQKIDEMDREIEQKISGIPPEKRVLITAHDAFNYFGREYEVKVKGLQGISTASEIAASDLIDLADFIVDNKIPAIFLENSIPQRNIDALIDAVQARGFDVKMGGELYSDSLGDTGTPEESYVGTFIYNVNTFYDAIMEK
jgi:manganese/zinc/iron transport system substrate-binding protein